MRPEALLRTAFDDAVARARRLDLPDGRTLRGGAERLFVLSVGKAAVAMADAVGALLPEADRLVVAPVGSDLRPIRADWPLIRAGHPIPDEGSIRAGSLALKAAEGLGAGDRMILLLSGGASAMLAIPAAGVSAEEKQALTSRLLASGVPIASINTVRKHLSAIKGGRLAAAAYPAETLTFAMSDVAGDDPAIIGSGPTVGDETTLADSREALERAGIEASPSVKAALLDPANETPKSGDPRLARSNYHIASCPADALAAATRRLEAAGFETIQLGEIEGDARALGEAHADLALNERRRVAFVSGGEATVTLRGASGRGGPNLAYLLALALRLDGAQSIYAFAGDSDGIDGTGPGAGAILSPDTLRRARKAGVDPEEALAADNSAAVFDAAGSLVVTGPTGVNVNDLRLILVEGSR